MDFYRQEWTVCPLRARVGVHMYGIDRVNESKNFDIGILLEFWKLPIYSKDKSLALICHKDRKYRGFFNMRTSKIKHPSLSPTTPVPCHKNRNNRKNRKRFYFSDAPPTNPDRLGFLRHM